MRSCQVVVRPPLKLLWRSRKKLSWVRQWLELLNFKIEQILYLFWLYSKGRNNIGIGDHVKGVTSPGQEQKSPEYT